MSNASGAPRNGEKRPNAPGSVNEVDDSTVIRPAVVTDDSTVIRPAVVTDDGPPTLAERIMASRSGATSQSGGGRGAQGRSTNGSAANGSDHPDRGGPRGGNGAAPSETRPAHLPQSAQSAPRAGAPNAGQPFRNGQPRHVAAPASAQSSGDQPSTYSPVPGGPPAGAQPPVQSSAQAPGSAASAQTGADAGKANETDAFSVWRKKPYPVVPDGARRSAASAGSATSVAPVTSHGSAARSAGASVAPAARAPQSAGRERLATGAGAAAVTTGLVAHGVPTPAPTASVASAPSSSSSAGAAAKSDKLVIRRTRKARLRLSRIDPWSVMKTAFMFSIAAGIVLVVAVYGLWSVIQASDMFTAVNQIVQDAVGTTDDTTPFQLEQYINTPKVMGATALIAAVDVLLVTALATLVAFLYNLSASVLGGLEVTLAED